MQGKLTASAVGSLVGMQAEEIQQIASKYADMVSFLLNTSMFQLLWNEIGLSMICRYAARLRMILGFYVVCTILKTFSIMEMPFFSNIFGLVAFIFGCCYHSHKHK